MKMVERLHKRFTGVIDTITRYPLTTVLLLLLAILNTITIRSDSNQYSKYAMTLMVGISLSMVLQAGYERFFIQHQMRIISVFACLGMMLGYYIWIKPLDEYSVLVSVKTSVIIFIFILLYLIIPSVKSKVSFNESFLVAFKAFFHSLFFSSIIFLGISIILFGINSLITSVDYRAYTHSLNIIFVLFAPIYFLSLIPIYQGHNIREDAINEAARYPRFLEILISYIIIPVTAIFTIILILYILININGRFWTDNLSEPLLVSYSISVLIVLILASRLDNTYARYFRLIFPKVLIPIVLLQTIASILRTGEIGITYGGYYAILFGVYAILVGILLSIFPVKKNGLVAKILVVFSAISILWPVDAFTISHYSQINRLEEILNKNEMLANDRIIAKASISDKDKQIIIDTSNYLRRTDHKKNIKYLNKFYESGNFNAIFGFDSYVQPDKDYRYINLYLDQNAPISISGYDVFFTRHISDRKGIDDIKQEFVAQNKTFRIITKQSDSSSIISLVDESNQDIIQYNMEEIFSRFESYTSKSEITEEEATFTMENELAKISLITKYVNMNSWPEGKDYSAELIILVKIK